MAVITKYFVVRNGLELDNVFTVKKEAEAYDKMLDAAENLAGFIKNGKHGCNIDHDTIDKISVFLAKNGPDVVKMLKGIRPLAPGPENKKSVQPQVKPPGKSAKPAKDKKTRQKGK